MAKTVLQTVLSKLQLLVNLFSTTSSVITMCQGTSEVSALCVAVIASWICGCSFKGSHMAWLICFWKSGYEFTYRSLAMVSEGNFMLLLYWLITQNGTLNFSLPLRLEHILYDQEYIAVSAIYIIRKISLFLLACYSQRLNLSIFPLLILPISRWLKTS